MNTSRPLNTCEVCGSPMTHHADKEVVEGAPALGTIAAHACGNCGAQAAITTAPPKQCSRQPAAGARQ